MGLIELIGGYLRNRLLDMLVMIVKMTENLHIISLYFWMVI